MYIHQLAKWPHFFWNQKNIIDQLIKARHLQGRLTGGMKSIGFNFQQETLLETLTQDVVKTSEIEGEILDQTLVRSSVARHLGIEAAAINRLDRRVEGVVEMMLDATENFSLPLTKERLFRWHRSLFPKGHSGFKEIKVGAWRRGRVDVVSGQMGEEVIHFEAPSADKVEHEIECFLKWINNEAEEDLVLKAAIAHLWFVTIHLFEDGNGRIGRAIADMLLARSENSMRRFYSMSAQIQKERKSYYAILERTQKGNLDITGWIEWFLKCLETAIQTSLTVLDLTIHKNTFWESIKNISLNERQRKMINCLLDGFEEKLTTSKWAKITKCSQDTAYRDILELIQLEILIKNIEGGRSTSYSLLRN